MDVKAIVIAGFGFNADAELARAFALAGAEVERVHLSDILAEPERLRSARILAFPGGFSFGDHLGSGQVVSMLCRRRLRPALLRFVEEGGLVIGVCNGFQSLLRMGMLPNRDAADGGGTWAKEASLVHNESGRFVDAWVRVEFEPASRCAWTKGLAGRALPVRHGEGRFLAADAATLGAIEAEGLVALRYDPAENPNGSEHHIAGICDPTGRVLGLMPHPEAFLIPENHPMRRRGSRDRPGIELFENGVKAARAAV
ncbi:MAG TPA: phosphoribosylformylglycinamidine synthase subunit PurQ [Rectinemataceae bacterium]|nr:phosphoribosylformylglycinamidine synthase subunit PurQ [Rectinemataceae bacterium]